MLTSRGLYLDLATLPTMDMLIDEQSYDFQIYIYNLKKSEGMSNVLMQLFGTPAELNMLEESIDIIREHEQLPTKFTQRFGRNQTEVQRYSNIFGMLTGMFDFNPNGSQLSTITYTHIEDPFRPIVVEFSQQELLANKDFIESSF